MQGFPIHTLDTAPDGSKAGLAALRQAVGIIPNLAAGMSAAPSLLNAFLATRELYSKGTFSGAEIQVLSIVAARENVCDWCVAFHTLMAKNEGIAAETIEALRSGKTPANARLAALSEFAKEMVQRRGAVTPATLDGFRSAGYTSAQALEVVVGMAFSLMANYAGHLINPPLDAPFQPYAWHAAA